MKFAIIGTGAVGGFYGGMLARAGNEVHFLLNSDYLHVKENGIKIQSDIHGTFIVNSVNAYNNITLLPKCDVVLVCLKSTQNDFLKLMGKVIDTDTTVVMVQNGLGIERDAALALREAQIAGALAFVGANKIGAEHIHHLEHGTLRIGGYNLKGRSAIDKVIDLLNKAGIDAFYTDILDVFRWQKLIWNMAFNGTCALYNCTTEVLLKNDQTRKMLYDLMHETVQGAKACGIELHAGVIEENIAITDKMQAYKPSMKLDFENGREMELKYIYQKPIELAEANGFEMRKMKKLLKDLFELQSGYLTLKTKL